MSTDEPGEVPQPLAVDEDQDETLRHKEVLQKVVVDLARYGPGRSVADLRQRLDVAVAEAGLPPQPERWVDAVASEAAEGRITVLDARFVPRDQGEERADEHDAGPGEGPDIGPNG
ncbi:hypothetical protein [Angustibacter peucedani]